MSLSELRPFLQILAVVYALITLWLAACGLHSWVLLVLYWLGRRPHPSPSPLPSPDQRSGEGRGWRRSRRGWGEDLPVVTVQLPIYNERYVVRRLIDAVAALEYPRDRLEIQVLDDSTDETTVIAQARAAFWRERGVDIRVLHRSDRSGFKAGALAWGLQQARGN